jgi:hypothetical protein
MVPDQWVVQLVAELLAISECGDVVIVTRKPITARSRVCIAVLDTGAADFAERTVALDREGFKPWSRQRRELCRFGVDALVLFCSVSTRTPLGAKVIPPASRMRCRRRNEAPDSAVLHKAPVGRVVNFRCPPKPLPML